MSVPEKARTLLRAGRVPDALTLLRGDASNPDSLALLREHLVGEGKSNEATQAIERLAADHGAEAHVSRSIKALLNGDVKQAAREAEQAVRIEPGSATAHNHLGRALHNLGQSGRAITAFERAVHIDPDYAQAWHNMGHVLRAAGRLPEAVTAYQEAVDRAPAFRAARLNLGISHSVLEEPERALECFEHLLKADANDVEALVNAGLALHQLGRLRQAQERLERALVLEPNHANAWCYLGVLCNERLDTEGALNALQKALKLNPADIEARVELAGALEQSNRLDKAREVVNEGLQRDPGHPALKLEAAKLERRAGNVAEAVNLLGSLPVDRLPGRIAQQVHFELGHALDRAGDYHEAYQAFVRGNELAARNPRRAQIDSDGFARRCEAIGAWLDAGAPGIEPGPRELAGDTGGDLVFLVGFPRSGTTLLDSFLNAHPAVQSVEERPTLEQVIEGLRNSGAYPEVLASLDADAVSGLRREYRGALEQHAGVARKDGRIILDKLPMRTLNVGLIQRLFPRARLLFALRHPCDVVLSNFMQSYADNEAFIHFDTLADSAGMYDRVMSLWLRYRTLLGIPVLETRYEDLVDDTRGELGRVCRFLGMELTDAMMDLENRLAQRGRIRTNSYQQVAEPVYARSRLRWVHYAGRFDPVLPQLRPYIDAFDYSEQAAGPGDRDG